VTFEEARAQFPVLERFAYLNAGTFGPLSRATSEALERQRLHDLEEGRSGAAYWHGLIEARDGLRAQIAEMLGVPPETMALTGSTTDGCNVVLGGLSLGPDDEVVTTDVEHPGLLGPLHASSASVRVARVRERPAGEALDAIRAEVTPRTRLLALSHVAWSTGNVLPVAELKAATGLPVLVDGAQSVGAIPVDVTPFDYYTVSGQKWLCGPEGTGALFVADPERLRLASPTSFGFIHDADPSLRPKPGAARFDTSWVGPGQVAGLAAALAGAPEWRFERALEQASRARERLAERAEVITAPAQGTLVTFRVDGDAAEAAVSLFAQGVVLRDLPGTGWLRASIGWWTSDEDVERLVAALPA
jgi:L-cysteine/cystine lyase